MPQAIARIPDASLSTLPGAAMLQRVRRLMIWALGAGLAYSVLGGAGKTWCPGGYTGDGGFIDVNGRPTDPAPQCISVSLQPGGIVYAVIALIVLATLTRVLRHAVDQADAIRRIDRVVIAIVAVVVVWTALTQVSFASISVQEWDGTTPFDLGSHLGTIIVDVYPMAY